MQPTRLTTSSVTVKPGPTSFTEAEWAEVEKRSEKYLPRKSS